MLLDPTIALQVRNPQVESPLDAYGRVLSLKSLVAKGAAQEEALKHAQLKRQVMERDIAEDAAFKGAIKRGASLAELAGISPSRAAAWQKSQNETAKAALEQDKLRVENGLARASRLGSIASSIVDEPTFRAGIDIAEREGLLPAEIAQQLRSMSWGPETQAQVKAFAAQAMTAKQQHEARLAEIESAQRTAEHQARLPGIQAESAKSQTLAEQFQRLGMSEVDKQRLEGDAAARAEVARHNQAVEAGSAESRAETARHNRATEGETARHNRAMEDGGGAITPEGLNMVAHQFAMTGQLPAMGMGAKAAQMRSAIINKAAELYPGSDLASNRAAYESNKASLAALQKSRDAIVAFEQTAGKNLDIFVDMAKKVVDSGVPSVNIPLRWIRREIVGDANMAAYDAARRVAINEIAKVTSNPNLTGQLSDAARKEIESFSPDKATLKQVLAVAQVLRQDMKNRHIAMDEQIEAIKKRIANAGAGVPWAGGTFNGEKVIKVTRIE